MKYIYFFLLIFSWPIFAQMGLPVQYSNPPKNHLVANYDFTNSTSYPGSGTTVNNIASNTTGTATLYNSPSYVGSPGYVSFNGTSQYLLTPNLKPYFRSLNSGNQDSFTMSMWIYPMSNDGVIVSELGQPTINYSYHDSNIEMVGGYLKFSIWPRSTFITSNSTVALYQWHHVAMIYDGATLKAYVDGALQGSATYARSGPSALYYGIAATDYTSMGSGAYGKFNLARFKLYNMPLHDSDILQEFNSEKYYFQTKLILDAGIYASYPGTGSTWYDLSGNQQNATNYSCGYNSTFGGGSIYYDGTNSYSDFYADVSSANTVTVETWVRLNGTGGMIFGWGYYDVWTYAGSLGYNSAVGDVYGISSTTVSNLGIVGNWKHMVFVMKTGSYLNNRIYINGVEQALSQQYASQNTTNITFNSGYGRLNCWRGDLNWRMPMYMATFKVYDRELTASEVSAKFNGEKSRYGL